ncbi:hypothetical protein D9613_011886 [Agrocybe pediades]|uniref:Uncharacterized protein n=1 Tax=Agrocybe pediades TaxID=84607 RepID=A0A8H4QL19_9AGAR|nr:hypothetical protein D9613_011886 [Agrocybe pediades]
MPTMGASSLLQDEDYLNIKAKYEIKEVLEKSNVQLIESTPNGPLFNRLGRSIIRYVFNETKGNIPLKIIAEIFATTEDTITLIINNNYHRKKKKNGDNLLDDAQVRNEERGLVLQIDKCIKESNTLRARSRVKKESDQGQQDSTSVGATLPTPPTSAPKSAIEKKKPRAKKRKTDEDPQPAPPPRNEADDGGSASKSKSRKRKRRPAGKAAEDDNDDGDDDEEEAAEPQEEDIKPQPKAKRAKTAPPPSASSASKPVSKARKQTPSKTRRAYPDEDDEEDEEEELLKTQTKIKKENKKATTSASASFASSSTTKATSSKKSLPRGKTPLRHATPSAHRKVLNKKQRLDLMTAFFAQGGGDYHPDYLPKLLEEGFGPEELQHLQGMQKDQISENLSPNVMFVGRPFRLVSFVNAIWTADRKAWINLRRGCGLA